MKDKRGFTLMELLVAVFIGSMVTIALVSIWKAASLQTSSGQRQSIIRNNLSIFLRSLHKDITEADVIVYPTELRSGDSSLILVGFRNAHEEFGTIVAGNTDINTFEPKSSYFSYCYDSANKKVLRKESTYSSATTVTDFLAGLTTCSGSTAMDNLESKPVIDTDDDINYNVGVVVSRDFNDKTPPVHIEFNGKFTISGGV